MSNLPPFKVGDVVRSISHDHSTARFGRTFTVTKLWSTRKGWRFEVNHPRFGPTSYYTEKFELAYRPPINSTTVPDSDDPDLPAWLKPSENVKMYIAVDITDTPLQELRAHDFYCHGIGVNTSEDVLKTTVKQWLEAYPGRKAAIFGLTSIAEVVGQPAVQFRDMRR